MCAYSQDRPRLLVEHRSLQRPLLYVQPTVAWNPFRAISGVHYMYWLCVVRRPVVGIAELGRDLPAQLAPGSPYARAIDSYEPVPEVRELLALCRRLDLST